MRLKFIFNAKIYLFYKCVIQKRGMFARNIFKPYTERRNPQIVPMQYNQKIVLEDNPPPNDFGGICILLQRASV